MMYPELAGWLSDAEANQLLRLAYGRNVLEIGTWKGRSAVIMAHVAQHVWCVDHFRGDHYTGQGWFLPEALANFDSHCVREKITVTIGDFKQVVPTLDLPEFELIFYDADHDYEPTAAALARFASHAALHTMVAVHDHSKNYPQVERAVAEIVDRGLMDFCNQVDTLAVLKVV